MLRFLQVTAAAVMLLSCVSAPAQGKKKVALLPVTTFKGSSENGRVVGEALRASLEAKGYELVASDKVDGAVKQQKLDLSQAQFLPALSKVRTAVGADYLVYARVLSVGTGINSKEYQANIIVNTVGQSAGSFLHTKQIGQVFPSEAGDQEKAVIPRASANEAAGRVLEGFYDKAK